MNLADQVTLENTIGRLHAVECALKALIFSHPDPAAFGETLRALQQSLEARPERDGRDPHVQVRQGFRDGCNDFQRAAEVAVSTGPGYTFLGNGNGHGHGHAEGAPLDANGA